MTTLLDQVPAGQITDLGRRPRDRSSPVLATLFLGIFLALGWLTGRMLLAAADCVIAIRIGYLRGRHGMTAEDAIARIRPAPETAPS